MKNEKKTSSLQIRLLPRTKRRLSDLANDKNVSMNDIVNVAVQNYIDEADMSYSAPDMVVDLINEVLVSQMSIISALKAIDEKIDNLD